MFSKSSKSGDLFVAAKVFIIKHKIPYNNFIIEVFFPWHIFRIRFGFFIDFVGYIEL